MYGGEVTQTWTLSSGSSFSFALQSPTSTRTVTPSPSRDRSRPPPHAAAGQPKTLGARDSFARVPHVAATVRRDGIQRAGLDRRRSVLRLVPEASLRRVERLVKGRFRVLHLVQAQPVP